jgi:oligosaccharide repeat unit polymerase
MLITFILLIALLFGIYYSYTNNSTVFTPLNLFSGWMLLYFGYYYLFLEPDARSSETYDYFILVVLCFYAGAFTFGKCMLQSLPEPVADIPSWRVSASLLIILAYIVFYFVFATYNVVAKQTLRIEELYSFKDAGANALLNMGTSERIINFLQRAFLPAFLLSIGYLKSSKAPLKWAIIFSSACISTIASLTQYTGRSNILFLIVTVIILYFNKNRKYEFIGIILTSITLVFALIFLGYLRHGRGNELEGMNTSEVFQQLGQGGEWEPIFIIDDLNAYQKQLGPKEHLLFFNEDLKNWFINWIPRAFWLDKPFTDFASRMTNEMYGEMLTQTPWTRTFTIVGQGLIWGGVVGVAVIGYLYGLLTAALFKLFAGNVKYHGVLCFLICVGCFNIRNALTTWAFTSISILLEVWLLDWIICHIFKKPELKLK